MVQPVATRMAADMSNNAVMNGFKCKTCPQVFKTLQSCLTHELKHISTPAKIFKKVDVIKRRKRPKRVAKTIDTPEEKEFKSFVKTALTLCEEGTELTMLCKLFQPEPDNLSCAYERVYYDLQEELKGHGNWAIKPFGSTVTGMAFKTSDIDFYLQLLNFDDYNFRLLFQKVVKILTQSRKFSKVNPIHRARVPIVKCTHITTGYNLDINVSSNLGVFNSEFIAKVLNLDKRLHPLMLIIKIWAKSWDITKTGRMTNYCIIWLVLFYLQNCKPAILPSIQEFQKDVPPKLNEGLNFSLNEAKINMRPQNNQNIRQLIKGFFNFYSKFDFKKNIVSPYLGIAINREEFQKNTINFPEYQEQLKLLKARENKKKTRVNCQELRGIELRCNTPMVVQDPFCLNANKAVTVGPAVFELFMKQILIGAKIVSNDSQPSSELLIRLFYETGPVPALPPMFNANNQVVAKTTIDKMNNSVNVCKLCPVENELLYVRTYLRRAFPEKTFDKIEVNKFWIEKIVGFTDEILRDIFKIRVSPDRTHNPYKYARTDGQSDVYSHKYSMHVVLQANIDFWTSRKNDIKKGYSAFLQEQLELTKRFETERKGVYACNLHCSFSLVAEADFSTIVVTMEDLAPKNIKSSFKVFFIEFTARIRNFFRAYFERLARES